MYITGRRGIRFQDKNGKMQVRAPGEPVPEAVDFRNIRALIANERIVLKEDVKKTVKIEPKVEVPKVEVPKASNEVKDEPIKEEIKSDDSVKTTITKNFKKK